MKSILHKLRLSKLKEAKSRKKELGQGRGRKSGWGAKLKLCDPHGLRRPRV